MFICEICKKNPATVHLTDIHNNEKKELHLCQSCAEQKGITFQNSFSLPDLLAGLTRQRELRNTPGPICKECGLSYRDFQTRGRLGCPQDYKAFAEEIEPMLERIHGRVQHVGKTPAAAGRTSGQQNLMTLMRQMRTAVEREDYEKAAALRDEINHLKQDLGHES
ncbi:MAG: UvrB/UvrC motif-containing protein [Planctomycetota bacterium]